MTVTARPLSAGPGHARDHPVMEIVPNKALSLSLSLRVSRAPARPGGAAGGPPAAARRARDCQPECEQLRLEGGGP